MFIGYHGIQALLFLFTILSEMFLFRFNACF